MKKLNQSKLSNIQNGKWEKNFCRPATLMNKIFEVVEANKLFSIDLKTRYLNSSSIIGTRYCQT